MPPKMSCPVCGSDMRSRSLLSYYSLKPYRECPDCKSKYIADPKTRKRRGLLLILTLIMLILTVTAGIKGFAWLLPAVLSHIGLWAYIGYMLSKMTYVPYPD